MEIGFVIGGIVIFGAAAVIVLWSWKKVKERKEARIFTNEGIDWIAKMKNLASKIMKWRKEERKAKILEP